MSVKLRDGNWVDKEVYEAMSTTTMMVEMRGFTAIASALAREGKEVGITPERVRAAGIDVFNGVVESLGGKEWFVNYYAVGGDTWCIVFRSLDEAVLYGCRLLKACRRLSVEKGFYYLKPSIAIRLGYPKTKGDRFLDDGSIKAYIGADTGSAFRLLLIGEAVEQIKASRIVALHELEEPSKAGEALALVEWQQHPDQEGDSFDFEVSIPALLLDSEILYSRNVTEAIASITAQQEGATRIKAFGGPAHFDDRGYSGYVKDTVRQILEGDSREWMVLSYLPADEPKYSFAWLELGRRLAVKCPGHYFFGAFPIPEGALRPFSYHVFDNELVHIGLRRFSPRRNTSTLSSSIMLRNVRIAENFAAEFDESWRKYAPLTDETYANITASLGGLAADAKKQAMDAIDHLLLP